MKERNGTLILIGIIFAAGTGFAWFFPFNHALPLERVIGVLSGTVGLFSAVTVIKRKIGNFIENHFSSWAKEKIVKPLGILTVLTNGGVHEIELEELHDRKEKAEEIVNVLLEEEEHDN